MIPTDKEETLKEILIAVYTVVTDLHEIVKDHERRIKELEDEGRNPVRRHSQGN